MHKRMIGPLTLLNWVSMYLKPTHIEGKMNDKAETSNGTGTEGAGLKGEVPPVLKEGTVGGKGTGTTFQEKPEKRERTADTKMGNTIY